MPASRTSRFFWIVPAAFSVLLPFASAQAGLFGARDRVLGPIDEADLVTLTGNTHPLARPENDRGAIPEETRLERLVLLLQPDARQQRQLDALSEVQQNPESPQYHQWLSPEEYGQRFGVSAGDLARISGWLLGHGFSVEPVPAGRRSILFSGTAGQVAETFHTEIHRYEAAGQMHIANVEDPQIPQALAPVVGGVLSLHDFRRVSSIRSRRSVLAPENTQGGSYYLFPADYATIYELNPLYAAGKNGSGVSIAIVGRSNITLSDVSSFRSVSGLIVNQPTVILDGENPGLVPGDHDESTLDVEWSGAVAPSAAVKFVAAASTTTSDGVDLAAQYIVNHKTAQVMSTSYGDCEAYMGEAGMTFFNNLWQQAATEGISVFVSSGDSGAAGCNAGSSTSGTVAGVNGLCSSPYSTCVGGTEFNEGSNGAAYWSGTNGAGGGSALSYMPEKVWNESGSDGGSGLWASTGGISEVYAQPNWQQGVSGASSNGMRAVPDVALTAAEHDGYLICENGNWYVIAGTSAASPSFAGIMAVVVQKAGTAGASEIGQGNANPTLYKMLSASTNPFHATPSGNNSVPGVTGFTASGASYNLATGLGSVDANLLVTQWPQASGSVQQGFALQASASSETLLQGKTATFTVSVTGTGGFTGMASLSATAPSGVTVAFNPASVKAGSSTTVTVSVSGAANLGAGTILITGSGSGITATAKVALTVQGGPSLAVSTAATTVSVVQGKTATLTVTATTGGTFNSTVNLAVTGLPAGVTSSWSISSFAQGGSRSTNVTLTLKAASTAALASSSLKITASGGGLQSQTLVTLQVTLAPAISAALSAAEIDLPANGMQQLTVTVTPQGGVRPAANMSGVSFQATGLPTGITASWGAPILTASGAVEATLTVKGSGSASVSSSTPTIAVALTDAVSGARFTANQQVSLQVTKASTMAIALSSPALTVSRGKTVTETVAVQTKLAQSVSMSLSGLPAGVSATWSENPVPLNPKNNQGVATLTLTAAGTAAANTGSFAVMADSSADSASRIVAVVVQ